MFCKGGFNFSFSLHNLHVRGTGLLIPYPLSNENEFYLTDSSEFILPYLKTFRTRVYDRSVYLEPESCVPTLRSTIYACDEDGIDNY